MMRRALLILTLLLTIAAPLHAAPVALVGYETTDESEGSEGGTAGGTTITAAIKRTGGYALQVAPTSGGSAYHDYPFAADGDVYARGYLRMTALPMIAREGFGFHNGTRFGCVVHPEPDGSVSLWYKDRVTYEALGLTGALTAAQFSGLELHQQNGSGGSCGGSCLVLCELSVNGTKVLTAQLTSVTSGDYGTVDRLRVGASDSVTSAYTAVWDDIKLDDSAPIGLGRLVPLTPDGQGANTAWSNGGNAGNCSSGASRPGCVDDFASGTHDGDSSYLETSSSGDKHDLALTDLAALATGESITSVAWVAVAREQTDGTRNYRPNLWNGSVAINGTSHETSTSYAYSAWNRSTTKPGGGSWDRDAVNGLMVQLEKTSSGTNRVTAVLAYADISEPAPPVRQNLQDWSKVCRGGSNAGAGCGVDSECPSGACGRVCIGGGNAGTACTAHSACSGGYCGGDGRITIAFGWDSRTQGTGLGTCSTDGSVSCTTNVECPNNGICNGTGKVPTLAASRITQRIGTKRTTILNCGINGNTSKDARTRAPAIISGVGIRERRYCETSMPTTCTPDAGCSAQVCGSNDCVNEQTGTAHCARTCTLVVGSYLCTGGSNVGADCTVDSECPGGACTSLPAADYVTSLAEINDLHVTSDQDCVFSNALRPPCPRPTGLATPNATPSPAPGAYFMPRVTCNANADCQTGRCANDMSKACGVDGDCPGSTCATAKKINGTTYCRATCSNDASRTCASNLECLGTGVCNGASICVGSCQAVPCTSNDRADGRSSQCGPTTLDLANNDPAYQLEWYGYCTNGWCDDCGKPGNLANTQHATIRKSWNAARVIANLEALATMVAETGRRLIWFTPPRIGETASIFAWSGSLTDLKIVRDWQLRQANVVDLWTFSQIHDQIALNPRCNNNPTRLCSANADCPGTGAQCVTFASTLRPQFTATLNDEVHQNAPGAAVQADAAGDYFEALRPVCSGDPTTECGRCSSSGAACIGSDTCAGFATGEKCLATDEVCSAAGKGVCTEERIGSRCTHDLGTVCSSNADCTAKGICRPEGLLAVGEG